jgi:hypothetical protein
MNKTLSIGLACIGLCGWFGAVQVAQAAQAADAGQVTQRGAEARPVDARVTRVRVDGAVELRIRQGNAPALTLAGDPRFLGEGTVTEQRGDTLSIESGTHGHLRMGALRVELILPALREVVSESMGMTDIAGFSGETLELTLDGAGSMRVDGNYRMVTANLGGIGSMRLHDLNAEGVKLNLQGAGLIVLNGRARWLKADLGGLGSLDAQELTVDNVNIDLSGLGNARVTAHQNVSLNLSGLGSVTVYGKPLNRKVAVDGLGKVSWK